MFVRPMPGRNSANCQARVSISRLGAVVRPMKITIDLVMQAREKLLDFAFTYHYDHLGHGHEGSGIGCSHPKCVEHLKLADALHEAVFAREETT